MPADAVSLLRPGLLTGVPVALAGPPRAALAAGLRGLGADLRPLDADFADEEATIAAAAVLGPVDALVVDAGARFAGAADAAETSDELAALRAAADGTWAAARSVASAAFIEPARPGKLLFLAPAPDAGLHAHAARTALENLARTTSIEWAQFGIRTVTITPSPTTRDDELTALVAYLLSPAGDYFSGTRLDLS
ncbi:MAG TPA: hypothetical protein VN238_15775 [Solirubrobacteraceae bacterium]|nr:hypothetical protein [Solirubrobacteraceae bacterium]